MKEEPAEQRKLLIKQRVDVNFRLEANLKAHRASFSDANRQDYAKYELEALRRRFYRRLNFALVPYFYHSPSVLRIQLILGINCALLSA